MSALHDVIKEMADMSRLLDAAVYDLAQYDEQAVIDRIEYKKAYARSFLTEHGSMEIRRQQAILDNADAELAAEMSEMHVRNQKEVVRKLGMQLELIRSKNAALQRQFMTEPLGQYT